MKAFLNGLTTGLVFQLAVGPAFFFIVNTALQKTTLDSVFAAVGVTAADYVFIILGVLGVGKLLQNKKSKKAFGYLGAIVLMLFGIFIVQSTDPTAVQTENLETSNLLSSFITAFLLTISSPLTIVFWSGLFTSKVIELGYTKKELFMFGLSCGLATFIFLGLSGLILSVTKTAVPAELIMILNYIVGAILILYGLKRCFNIWKTAPNTA